MVLVLVIVGTLLVTSSVQHQVHWESYPHCLSQHVDIGIISGVGSNSSVHIFLDLKTEACKG